MNKDTFKHSGYSRSIDFDTTYHVSDLLNRLLYRIVENLKVDRAIIIVEKNNGLFVEADVAFNKKEGIVVKSAFQLHSELTTQQFPELLVRHVLKSGNHLSLKDPSQTPRFAKDPYFKSKEPDFIYCTTVVNEARKEGILYIESKRKHLTINEEEFEHLLSLWTDQASLSFENRRWLNRLQENLKDRMHEISNVKRKNQANIQFLADMNHEVRAPLNTIMGFSQLLMRKDRLSHLPVEIQRYLENIHSSGNKLVELLENVLEFSRIDCGKATLVKENVKLRLLLRSVYMANRQLMNNKMQKIAIELSEDFPESAFCDRSALTKVLMSMLRFLIKKAPKHEKILFSGSLQDDQILIRVADSKFSEPSILQDDLFYPFSSNAVEDDVKVDRNLELAISAQLVKKMQGTLSYYNDEAGSSAVELKLLHHPQKATSDALELWKTHVALNSNIEAVLVKDPLSDWKMLASMLKDLGVKFAEMSFEDIGLLDLQAPKSYIIFIDLHTQGLDRKAIQFIQQLKAKTEFDDIPMVAVTSDRFHRINLNQLNLDPVDFLVKPFGICEIVEILQNRLDLTSSARTSNCLMSANRMGISFDASPDIYKSLFRDLEELTVIPIFKGGTIITRLNAIQEKYQLSTEQGPTLIGKLKSAVYEGNEEKFRIIIKKAKESIVSVS